VTKAQKTVKVAGFGEYGEDLNQTVKIAENVAIAFC